MNKLIAVLQEESNLTILRLKQIYRHLCKKLHPDLTKESGLKFIALQIEYNEALSILSKMNITDEVSNIHYSREAVLENLYLYAAKFIGSDSEKILLKLIELTRSYRIDVSKLFVSYYKIFFKNFSSWRNDPKIFFTHNTLISCIYQLCYFDSLLKIRHKRIFNECYSDLNKNLKNLNVQEKVIIKGLADWLLEEIEITSRELESK